MNKEEGDYEYSLFLSDQGPLSLDNPNLSKMHYDPFGEIETTPSLEEEFRITEELEELKEEIKAMPLEMNQDDKIKTDPSTPTVPILIEESTLRQVPVLKSFETYWRRFQDQELGQESLGSVILMQVMV